MWATDHPLYAHVESVSPDSLAEVLRMVVDPLRQEVERLRADLRNLAIKTATPSSRAVDVAAAAALLGCSEKQVFRLLADGRLTRTRRIGRKVMVTTESIEAASAPVERPRARRERRSNRSTVSRRTTSPAADTDRLVAAVSKLRI